MGISGAPASELCDTRAVTSKSKPRREESLGAALPTAAQACVGCVESGNTVVLVTATATGEVLDRREVALTEGLPTHPHHHEGSWAVGRYRDSPWARAVTLEEALALVERVRSAAHAGASRALDDLEQAVTGNIVAIALRECPELPPTVEACIRDNRAQSYADSVMYRRALAVAAERRGWAVVWYDREAVFDAAAKALGKTSLTPVLTQIGKRLGAPWQAKHKLATAAAIDGAARAAAR